MSNKVDAPLTITPELYKYIIHINDEDPLLKKARDETKQFLPERAIMQTPPDEAKFLGMIVKLIGAKKAVEIGVFTGYSSISIAQSLPDDGKLYAFDISEEYTSYARKYWEEGNLSHKIDLRIGNAVEQLDKLLEELGENSVDFAFLDADKVSYKTYVEKCLKLVRIGGAIVIDNTLWGGNVIKENNTEPNNVAIKELNEFIKNDDRLDHVLMGFADGVTLCIRKK